MVEAPDIDGWRQAASPRRAWLTLLIFFPTFAAVQWMADAPWFQGTPLEIALLSIFALLFGWTMLGFWTAVLGFVVMLRGERYSITSLLARAPPILSSGARTAVVMPICNEDAQRVFAGLGAVYRSLARTHQLDRFEFFALSDTQDPACWVEEEEAWDALCRALGRPDAIHYRRRRNHIKRKSGNIAEFLRRHGRRFRYFIVLDADSIMTGTTMVDLVRIMERRPTIGILQTLPLAVGRVSLIARAQQFAQRVYGPMFAAGINYWQLGETHYWGHNAIIRTAPFMRHCLLPRLPGRAPLGGEILSHDFVEAALMRRAGYEVWLAPELGGSYEETPPSLLDELKRDRRWCQGNLQHLRLLTVAGLHPLHRVLFVNGALSYVSAALWLLLIVLGGIEAMQGAHNRVGWMGAHSLLPLFVTTLVMLLLPKVLGAALVTLQGRLSAFAGVGAFSASLGAETLLSVLFAPIRMIFYSRFVLATLLGRTVQWRGQRRDDYGTSWGEALRRHGVSGIAALAFGVLLWRSVPGYVVWVAPVLVPLMLAAPLSVWTSRASLGRRARDAGLFIVPEERRPPRELVWLFRGLTVQRATSERHGAVMNDPCLRALMHPQVNALHLSLLPRRAETADTLARHAHLRRRVLEEGMAALSVHERLRLLSDPVSVTRLHTELWAAEAPLFGESIPPPDTANDAAVKSA